MKRKLFRALALALACVALLGAAQAENLRLIVKQDGRAKGTLMTMDARDGVMSGAKQTWYMSVGDTQVVRVYGDRDIWHDYSWKSDKPKVVSVTEGGEITAHKPGKAKITIKGKFKGTSFKNTLKVVVTAQNKPSKVTLNQTGTVVLDIDKTLQLEASLLPVTAVSGLTWSVKKGKSVTVTAGGLVTPVKEGTSTVQVRTANKKTASVKVKVVDPYKPTKVQLYDASELKLQAGTQHQLTALLAPASARTTFKWTSSKPKVASVDANGLITAHKKGTAKITVTTANKKKARITVKVTAAPAQPVQRQDLSVYIGKNLEDTAAKLGLAWTGGNTVTGFYKNDEVGMGWQLEKYWSEAQVEHITIYRDPKGRYSLYGIHVGMSEAEALKLVKKRGLAKAGSYKNETWYGKGDETIWLTVSGKKVTQVSLYVENG